MNTVTPFKLHSREQLNEAKMLSDLELVERIVGGDLALYELIMRRYNQRLFRIARSILQDDGEAEDMVQDTWIKAYEKLATFRGPQGFASWLCRIATNMAIMRSRRADWSQPHLTVDNSNPEEPMQLPTSKKYTPEGAAWNGQLRQLIENAIDKLPDAYRLAFVMREVEQMSVQETASLLDIKPQTVKTRVFRAKQLLQEQLKQHTDNTLTEAFSFAGHRCNRIVAGVFQHLSTQPKE